MLNGINAELALPILPPRPQIKFGKELPTITGKCVMITGAGGSIGSELSKQVASLSPRTLVLVDHGEYNLYEISLTINEAAPSFQVQSYIADVRDARVMRRLFRKVQPDVVLHAAALKHVPLMEHEHNLLEGVRTNVLGTKVVCDLSVEFGAGFLMISTDKAVNPSSCMGLTKRAAEIYVHTAAIRHPEAGLKLVRFGNVFGSSGSVVPLFKRQIAKGGPVTVTHRQMERYMMTISEAVQLVLSATTLPASGLGLYLLDMGDPINIYALAVQLIEQAGLQAEVDIPIAITGLRPGEKLHEELHYAWEEVTPTDRPRVLQVTTPYNPFTVCAGMDRLLSHATQLANGSVLPLLREVVPEYTGDEIAYF